MGNQTVVAYEKGDELAGSRIALVAAPNAQISHVYDSRNRVTQQTLVSVKDDGLSNPTQIQYNARGDVAATTYEYNSHRERIQQTNPANETVRYHYDSRQVVKGYNPAKILALAND